VSVCGLRLYGHDPRSSDLIANPDWGDPRGYDITVIRKGKSLDTEYTVQPSPHKALHPDIEKAFGEKKLKLEALFDGGDPFAGVGISIIICCVVD
jgi:hypothetical protein